jgi:hypothetical protein
VIVTYIYSNNQADQIRIQVRCRNMVDAINRTGIHHANLLDMTSFIQNTDHAQTICSGSDLLVIYRYLYGPVITAVQYWKARDKKVIVDFDQAFNYLTDNKPAYSFWFEGMPLEGLDLGNIARIDPAPIEQFKWGLAMMDAATVPSVRLVDDWSRFTKAHRVLDYINTHHYPTSDHTHGNEIWIGLGSRVDYDCFEKSGLLTAMVNVCRKQPQVKLVLSGMEEAFAAININSEQLKVYSPHSFEDWVDISLHLDIGLMPIAGDYDLRLGSYDLLEFMISKIPWIASQDSTFHNLSQYGQWVRNTPDAWENVILNTMEQLNVHQRKAVGEPFLFALNQDISVNIDRILKVYSTIISH